MKTKRTRIITAHGVEVLGAMTRIGASGGDLAVEVFVCLDEGVSPTNIVIQLKIPPAQVDGLRETWARLRGHVLLPSEVVAKLDSTLPIYVGMPLQGSASVLVERVAALADGEPRSCVGCDKQLAQYCGNCPGEAAREAAAACAPGKTAKSPRSARRR